MTREAPEDRLFRHSLPLPATAARAGGDYGGSHVKNELDS